MRLGPSINSTNSPTHNRRQPATIEAGKMPTPQSTKGNQRLPQIFGKTALIRNFSRGRRFKSCHPDRKAQVRAGFSPGLRRFCCPFRRGLWKHPTTGADALRVASIAAVATSRDLAGTWSPFWPRSAAFSSPRCRRSTGRSGAVAVGLFVSVEERVGACGSVGEVPSVGVEVPAGRLN